MAGLFLTKDKEVKMFSLEAVSFKNILEVKKLKLKAGQITAVLGSSGSGKTTFLKLLNNMISADSGKIEYKNKDLKSYDPVKLRREVVMLPQNPEIFAGTIKDNFKIAEEIDGSDFSKNSDYRKILKKVSLEHSLDNPADKLSGGEKQRLALARIILLKPEVLLLDEPSASLDKKTEENIIKMVAAYVRENDRTLIMVSHSPQIAAEFADRIIKIEAGKIIEE